jgi:hypothetical protein
VTVQEEIIRAGEFGEKLESLLINKPFLIEGRPDPDRDKLLVLYCALVLDYYKSILSLAKLRLYGGAFALLRVLLEGHMRAHVVVMCRPKTLLSIMNDSYHVGFKGVAVQIDANFKYQGRFETITKSAVESLHSFTHSGSRQLERRYIR